MDSLDQDEYCVICWREINIYATGRCDHPVCYQCSTRMRVLCETNECPICRSNMPVVIFTHLPEVFTTLSAHFPLRNQRYNIAFEDDSIQKAFELLLESKCKSCEEIFHTFDKLKEHVRRRHELHFCDLCVNNLKIFTFERKCYSRKDLARHKRVGDPDETSLRGHPLCEFCDQRYVDDDDLFRHLRREHYFCHFCDADHKYPFYKDYEYLKVHFRKEHFLCEEGDCAREKFTGAFRSEIDLKAHISKQHAKNKSKAEMKQARMLEFEFTYAHRNHPSGSSSPRQSDSRGGRFGQFRKRNIEDNSGRDNNNKAVNNNQQTEEVFNTQSTQDFPYLSEDVQDTSKCIPQSNSNGSTHLNSFSLQSYGRNINPQRKNIMSTEDFPALCSTTVAVTSEGSNNHGRKINFSINQQNNNTPMHSSNVSIQLSQKSAPQLNPVVAHGMPNLRKKPSRHPVFQIENTDEKNSSSSNPKWINKKSSTNFEEDFPKLAVRETVVPQPKIDTSLASVATTISEPEYYGSQFVTIKCQSKKKKQNKAIVDIKNKPKKPVEDCNKNESSTGQYSSHLNRNMNDLLDNQENKDPYLSIITTVSLPKPDKKIEESPWENKVCFLKEDFPPLEAAEPPKKPPGFGTPIRTPPPGFGAKVTSGSNAATMNISLSSVARQITVPNNKIHQMNDDTIPLDYTNVQKSCYINSMYSKLPDFDRRNDRLIQRIRELADSNMFSEFKSLSGNFRQGRISAAHYHTKCLDVLGEDAFLEIYPELVSLLPDINKQQELLAVHNRFLKQELRSTGAIPKKSIDVNPFFVCETCHQVLIRGDQASHLLIHHKKNTESKKK